MEIGLSEAQEKLLMFISGCCDKHFPKTCKLWIEVSLGSRPSASFMISRTQLKFKNHYFLRLQVSTVCPEN